MSKVEIRFSRIGNPIGAIALFKKPGELLLDGSGPSSLRRPRTGGVYAVLVSDQLLGHCGQEGPSINSQIWTYL